MADPKPVRTVEELIASAPAPTQPPQPKPPRVRDDRPPTRTTIHRKAVTINQRDGSAR